MGKRFIFEMAYDKLGLLPVTNLQIYTYFLKQSPRKLIDIVTTAHLRGSQGPWAHVSA